MANITKINKSPIGEFEIKFSVKFGRFEIDYPKNITEEVRENLRTKVSKCPKALLTWTDVENELERIKQEYLHEVLFVRKVIIIQLKTSESDYLVEKKGWLDPAKVTTQISDDFIHESEGFELKWYVAEEYCYHHDVFGKQKDTLKYKITERNKNAKRQEKIDILPQLILGGGEPRVYDYNEDLHNFLLNLEKEISEMLKRMTDYFSRDQKVFLQNVMSNTKLLSSSESESKKS